MSDQFSRKLREALKDGVHVLYRMKEHRIDYSVMNRPHPQLSGVDDHTLATALVFAGREYPIASLPQIEPTMVNLADGRSVSYNESIEVSFLDGKIRSTRSSEVTLKVLSIVIIELMRNANPSGLLDESSDADPSQLN